MLARLFRLLVLMLAVGLVWRLIAGGSRPARVHLLVRHLATTLLVSSALIFALYLNGML